MKFRSGSRYHHLRLAAVALLILIALIFFILRYKKGATSQKIVNTAIDGVNLTYLDFDKNNQKKLEIKCLESQKQSDDRLLMKKITATIFNADKLQKDIHIFADSGYASNSFHDFHLQGNASISSPEFFLSSHSYYLKSLDVLTTGDAVDFKLQNISGRAATGLEYFVSQGTLKLFDSKGTWVRNGQSYDFKTQTLWVIKKSNVIIFQKKGELVGAGATVRGDWISLQFEKDFDHLQSASVIGNSYFISQETGENGLTQSKEISADMIKMTYDPEGRLQQITVNGSGKIILAAKNNISQIESNVIEISLRSETQTLEKIMTLTKGIVSNRGQNNVMVSGDFLWALYSPTGVLSEIKAENRCEFSTDDFRGTAATITYDAAHYLIELVGNDASIFSKNNIFESSSFLIHTRRKQINSNKGVKAMIMPEKKNVLLSRKSLFINATGMEMTNKGNVIYFKEKVKLFQDDIELHAGEMLFDNLKNRMAFKGNVDLKFLNGNEPLVLRGQAISFNTPERKIVVAGDARLNQAENILGGRQIELNFGRTDRLEKVFALDNVTFSKEDLSGQSQWLDWNLLKKTILFKNSAQITRKDAGTTKGRELLLDLSSSEIKVSSQEDRTETIINQD